MKSRVFLGCGANLGDRRANIEAALAKLNSAPQVEVLRSSAFYETEPLDYRDQPDFINSVVELETTLEPEALLHLTRQIEEHGNTNGKSIPKGPREIDLDILLWGEREVEHDKLQVPHPAMCSRKFVLIPLIELAPELECPTHHQPFSRCLAAIDDPRQRVERCDG